MISTVNIILLFVVSTQYNSHASMLVLSPVYTVQYTVQWNIQLNIHSILHRTTVMTADITLERGLILIFIYTGHLLCPYCVLEKA